MVDSFVTFGVRLAKMQFYEMDRWDGGCIINLTPCKGHNWGQIFILDNVLDLLLSAYCWPDLFAFNSKTLIIILHAE